MERTTRLLIVDDESQIRETYGEFFAKRGFEIELASNGREALDKLAEGVFDVAIVDIRMPQMDGIELASRVAEKGIDTSVIILTGHGDKEDAIEAINLGVGAWFEKDKIEMDELLETVNELAEVIPLDEVRRILSVIPSEER